MRGSRSTETYWWSSWSNDRQAWFTWGSLRTDKNTEVNINKGWGGVLLQAGQGMLKEEAEALTHRS